MKKIIALVLAVVTVLLCTACDKWENPELLEGQIPVVLPEQAYVVSQILEAIYTSSKTGKPVYFE